jgi:hypothetical protein
VKPPTRVVVPKKVPQKVVKTAAKKAAQSTGKKVATKLVKKGAGAVLRKVGGPITVGLFFAVDWYRGGFTNAVNEATWPVSEVWS